MKPSTGKKRKSRRSGPVHFIEGLFLEALGFAALIFTLLGLGSENWLLSLISTPVTEVQSVASSRDQSGFPAPAADPWNGNNLAWSTLTRPAVSASSVANINTGAGDRTGLRVRFPNGMGGPTAAASNKAVSNAAAPIVAAPAEQTTWHPAAPRDPYLGHNSPWTSRH